MEHGMVVGGVGRWGEGGGEEGGRRGRGAIRKFSATKDVKSPPPHYRELTAEPGQTDADFK
jgi:hypothetical protein